MRAALAFSCAMLLTAPATATEYRLRVVARVGAPAPAGGMFDRFNAEPAPIIIPVNRRGEVAFFAKLVRTVAREGLFVSGPTRTARIAAEGDRVAGAGVLSGFGRHPVLALNDSGTVAFYASLARGRAVEGVFIGAVGRSPRIVALTGQPAPGIASGTISALDTLALNGPGAIAFGVTVQRGRDTIDAIYLWSGGRLRKVVAGGDPTPIGGSFTGFGPPSLNDHGVVAFAALVEGGRALGALFLADPVRGVRTVAATGDETPLGGYFVRFAERLSLNDADQVAFHALVDRGSSPGAIFLAGPDPARVVAAVGGESPTGGRFAGFGLWPALAPDGAVAFVGMMDGGNVPVAIFRGRESSIEAVVAVGAASPAGPIESFGLYPSVSLNAGVLAFPAVPTAATQGAEALLVAEPR